MFLVPLWSFKWWRGFFTELAWYLFLRKEPQKYAGHNPLGQFMMFTMLVLGGLFMIFTGFALYSEGLGQGSWADTLFGWVIPLFGQSQDVHRNNFV